jgi:hypothetical protein
MHIRDLKMKNSRESNNNKQQNEIIMKIGNTNKPHRNRAVALLGAAFLCIAGGAQAATWTFNLERGCTAQNTAGDTIRVTGEGAFDPVARAVLGSGNYSIRNAAGKVTVTGSWSATAFGTFSSDGGPNTGSQGGTLHITVTLHPDGGAPQPGLPMTVICPFVNGAFQEGGDATLVGQFTTSTGGETEFHIE